MKRLNWKKSYKLDSMINRRGNKSGVLDKGKEKSFSEYLATEVTDFSYENLKQEIMPLIKDSDVEKVSSYLAVKDINNKMDYQENDRLSKVKWEDRNKNAYALEKSDPFFSSFSSEDDNIKLPGQDTTGDTYEHHFSFKDQVSDPQDFKDSLLMKEIKKRYYKNKFDLFGYKRFHNSHSLEIPGGVTQLNLQEQKNDDDLRDI